MKKAAFIVALGALAPLLPAHAVVLEQKWQAGQSLSYQTALRGTANVQAPATAPFIFAGVPLEVEVSGEGLTQLQTLAVDEAGVGTVVVRVPKFDLSAQTLGQQGHVTLQDEKSRISLNGKTLNIGDGTNPLAQPKVAIRVSREGKLVGFKNLEPKTVAKTAPQADKPVAPAQAIDQTAMLLAAITRALPTLWPGHDVNVGDTWKANVTFPTPSPTQPKTSVPTEFGAWDLTYKGSETVAGKELQRIGVVGKLAVDSNQFDTPDQKSVVKPRGKASQNVSGDFWVDADAGQIVRADLVLGARAEGGKTKDDQTWADFTGTLQLKLKDAA